MGLRRFATALALATSLTLSFAPARAQDQAPAADTPGPAIAVGADTVSDADIANRIDGIFLAVAAFDDVTHDVSSGVVTLTGAVPETSDITRLGDIVAASRA